MSLNTVDHMTLQNRVEDEIAIRMAGKSTFSAYNITQALRTANPTDDIPHGEVRELVHAFMSIQSDYEGNSVSGAPASYIEYAPKVVPVAPIATAKPTGIVAQAKKGLSWLLGK